MQGRVYPIKLGCRGINHDHTKSSLACTTMSPHDSSSVVPPTSSPTRSTAQMSCSFDSQPLQLNSPSPCPASPLPTVFESLSTSDPLDSDLDDSESDSDVSPIIDAMTVCRTTNTSSITIIFNCVSIFYQTIPIPQNPADARDLVTQAYAKRKSALHKSKLADANFREATLKAKLSRSRAQQARQALDAANIYLRNVHWTIQRSKHKEAWTRPSSRVMTTTGRGLHGTQGVY